MRRYIPFIAAALLAACSSDPTTTNRDTLGTSQTMLAAAQSVALNYRARPACPAPVLLCRDAAVYAEMQRLDRIALAANNAAYDALKRDPAAASTKFLAESAMNAIKGFDAFTREQGSK